MKKISYLILLVLIFVSFSVALSNPVTRDSWKKLTRNFNRLLETYLGVNNLKKQVAQVVSSGSSAILNDDNRRVWFVPNSGTEEFLLFFTNPSLWQITRSNIDVFGFYTGGLEDASIDFCPSCGSRLTDLVSLGAFDMLRQAGIKVGIEVPGLKWWACSAQYPNPIVGTIDLTSRSINNIQSNGGLVDNIRIDTALIGGLGTVNNTNVNERGCGFGMGETATWLAEYIRTMRSTSSYSHIKIGDIEPYPRFSKEEIIEWINLLENKLALLGQPMIDFFHLDVDTNISPSNQDMYELKTFFANKNIPFGIINHINSDPYTTDHQYFSSVVNFVNRVKNNNLTADQFIFQGWDKDINGIGSIPRNLPENDPNIFSHTRLVLEGLRLFFNNDAQFVSQNVPATMVMGQSYPVSITFRNSGEETWLSRREYKLGSQSPQDNTNWGISRIPFESSDIILPNNLKTFTFTVQAPEIPGLYNFGWQMIQEGVEWFGEESPSVLVTVGDGIISGGGSGSGSSGASNSSSSFISQNVPTNMVVGQDYPVSITFRNSGGETWLSSGGYKLGSQSPQDNTNWGVGRVELDLNESISSNSLKTFSFTARAPATPGAYSFEWQMIQEGIEWFGEKSSSVLVTVGDGTTSGGGSSGGGSGSGSSGSSGGGSSGGSNSSSGNSGGSSGGGSSSPLVNSSGNGVTTPVRRTPSSSPTIAQLEAKILELRAILLSLLQQRGLSLSTTGQIIKGTTSFTRDLTLGSKGPDVLSLQRILNQNGFIITSAGIGSPGLETDYFGDLTRSALIRFQIFKGITPASGYFGPLTRKVILGL